MNSRRNIIQFTKICLLTAFTASLNLAIGQSRISGSFDKTPFRNIVGQIEKETDYRFFYEEAWIDSVTVTGEFANATVPAFMKQAFRNSRIQYFVDSLRIILTNNVPIIEGIDYTQGQSTQQKNYSFLREFQATVEESAVEQKIYEIGKKESVAKSGTVALTGYIKDKNSGEPIPGAYVYVK